MMNKVLIGLIGAGVIATGGYAAATSIDDAAPARTVSIPGATTSDDTTASGTTTGRTTTDGTTTAATTTDDTVVGNASTTTLGVTTGGDISGPCDEAEHANDPRCTGVGRDDRRGGDDRGGDDRGDDDDRSGRGRGGDDNDDDDRSGSNSGRG